MIEAFFVEDGKCRVSLYESVVALISEDTQQELIRSLRCQACGERLYIPIRRCNCGGAAPDSVLEYLHARLFDDTSGFIGTYVCQAENWPIIQRKLKKDRANLGTILSYLKRLDKLDTVDKVQHWINVEYPKQQLIVDTISIPCVSEVTSPEYADLYKRCFRDSECKTHGYLKWVAINWVTGNDLRYTQMPVTSIGADIEVTYVISGNPVTKKWSEKGPHFIIPKEYRGGLPRGIAKIADVYRAIENTFIECGETDAMSLVAPIVTGLAKRVVWLPYLGLSRDDPLAITPGKLLPAYSIRKAPKRRKA